MNRLTRTGARGSTEWIGAKGWEATAEECYVKTSSGSDSGFTADRAIGSARSSVASSSDRSFKDCARLASLADGANGALNLRAPSLDSVSGPFGLVLLPAPESGAAHVCFSSSAPSGRGAVIRRARSEAELTASPSEQASRSDSSAQRASGKAFMANALTATAADNLLRSAGSFVSSPTYRPVPSFSTRLPADLHASIAVDPSSHRATPGTAAPASSASPKATHPNLRTYPGSPARGSGGESGSSLVPLLAAVAVPASHYWEALGTPTHLSSLPTTSTTHTTRPTGSQLGRPPLPACVGHRPSALNSQEMR
jgi:hypothetical protein